MGKVAAVVGVGPGNGSSLAERFAAEGFDIALLSRTTSFGEELAESLPTNTFVTPCDATDPEAIRSAFDKVREALGPVDVLLYNAGSGSWAGPDEATPEQLELAWKVNCQGLLVAAQQVVSHMKKSGGSIIVTGATASLRGKPFTTVFAQAKAAQRSLCQSMAREWWPKGVHVALIILDAMVDLERTRERMPDKPEESFLDPDDFAHAAWMLHTQPRSAWSHEIDVRPHVENW